jgi:hypothetical protein
MKLVESNLIQLESFHFLYFMNLKTCQNEWLEMRYKALKFL